MPISSIQASREGTREFANEAVVGNAEIAEFECEADEVGDEVGCMESGIDEDSAVD